MDDYNIHKVEYDSQEVVASYEVVNHHSDFVYWRYQVWKKYSDKFL